MKNLFTKTFYIIAAILFFAGAAITANAQTSTANLITQGAWASAVAKDGNGNIYVLENPAHDYTDGSSEAKILKYTNGVGTPTTIYSLVSENTEGQQDDYPVGLAVTSNGDVYVTTPPTDENGDIFGSILKLAYNSGNNSYSESTFITGSSSGGPFGYTSLAVDGSNNLYALQFDPSQNSGNGSYEIIRFNASGGVPSTGSTLIVNGSNILYTAAINNYDFGAGDQYQNETGLTVDPSGNIYAADSYDVSRPGSYGGAVYKFSPSGGNYTRSTFLTNTETVTLASDASGNIYAMNGSGSFNCSLVEYPGGSTASPITLYSSLKQNSDWFPFGLAAISPINVYGTGGQEGGSGAGFEGNFYQFLGAPVTQASGVSFSSVATTTATVSWTNGSGANRVVFISNASTGNPAPANSTNYTANTNFGNGTQIGATGWYCIYNGTGSSVAVTGLTSGQTYRVAVLEYNGTPTGSDENYLQSGGTNNPNNVTTSSPTTVTQLVRNSANPTNGSSVSYLLSFAAPVSGLTASNFTVSTTGTATGSVGTISGSGTDYGVAVNIGAGEGTVTLNLNNSTGLSSPVTNAPYAGQPFTIDHTAPVVTSVQVPANGTYGAGGTLSFVVAFNEPVTVNTGGGTPYIGVTLNTGGTVHATYQSGSTGTQLTFSYTVASGNADPDGIVLDNSITANGGSFSDFAGNSTTSETLNSVGSTSGVLVDGVAPQVNSITATGSSPTKATTVSYTVTFTEPVTGVTADDFTATTTGGATASSINLSGSGSNYTVNVTGVAGTGTVRLDLNGSGTGITDGSGNPITSGFTSGDVYTIDNTAPTISIGSPSVASTTNGPVSYTVTYSDNDGFNTSTLSTSDITLNATGTASGTIAVTGSGTSTPTVTISGITGGGTIGISIAAGTGSDQAGNLTPVAGPSATFNVGASDAALSALALSSGTLNPDFDAAITSYSAGVDNSVTSIIITPTTHDVNATVTVNGGSPAIPVNLAAGQNIIPVVVTAQDGTTKDTYTVTVTRAPSTDANLTRITTNTGVALTKVSGPDYKDFVMTVPFSTSGIRITATQEGEGATIKINGTTETSGVQSDNMPLSVGANPFNIVITAQDGSSTKTYKLTVTRIGNNDALLTNIGNNVGRTLVQTAGPDFRDYTFSVPYYISTVQITPTADDANATIKVNGTTVASGASTADLPLAVGDNDIAVVVTAQDGTTKNTYDITVTRGGSAKLVKLATNTGMVLNAVAGPDFKDFAITVDNSVTSVQITGFLQDLSASMTINGAAATSGTPSSDIHLSVGDNTFNTIVMSVDGVSTNTYGLTITRQTGPLLALYAPKDTLSADGLVVHPGITPNGDGVNDIFTIDGINAYPDNKVTIMGRSGAVVFEAKGYDNQTKFFDGHSSKNGSLQTAGTYFYSLEYKVDGKSKIKTGFVVLKY